MIITWTYTVEKGAAVPMLKSCKR